MSVHINCHRCGTSLTGNTDTYGPLGRELCLPCHWQYLREGLKKSETAKNAPPPETTPSYTDREEAQRDSSSSGYLYVALNPSYADQVKIGKTRGDPHGRVSELGAATGVPQPFLLVFDAEVDDCHEAEKYVHNRLAEYRVAKNREFYKIPANEAVKVILEAQKKVARGGTQS